MEKQIKLPISERDARSLRRGDILYVTGKIFTARDEAHHLMLDRRENGEEIPFHPEEMALFHCGPVMKQEPQGWRVIAAGPTTSIRMELFEDHFLSAFKTRIVIGKGGMGDRTQTALETEGAIYAHYTGGAGALAAGAVSRVDQVFWLQELGMPEAVWVFEVERFGPLLVTMDSVGGNLYKELDKTVSRNRERIDARIGA